MMPDGFRASTQFPLLLPFLNVVNRIPYFIVSAVLALLMLWMSACRKDVLNTDPSAKLSFSNDSVYFDTVFVTFGSVTKRFKVYNPHSERIRISNIRLSGGNNSFFRLNIDGLPANEASNVEIEGGDSIFVFCEVTIDPNNELNPFVVSDSVMFETNGNTQQVKLVAYGRNADFFRPTNFPTNGFPAYSVLDGSTTWTNVKPKVIIGYLVVDSAQTLTIEAGTQVFLYNNSGLWVYKQGTLKVMGTATDSVVFQGVRKEPEYREEPGQWDRIWINQGSTGNEIHYAVIKNGNIGLQLEDVIELGVAPQGALTLSNTRIRNMRAFGIYGVGYRLDAWNTVVGNCGAYGLAFIRGGNYRLRHCTFANYWGKSVRSEPNVFLSNAQNRGGQTIISDLNFEFANGIVYGNLQNGNELVVEGESGAALNWQFKNSLLRIDNADINTSDPTHFVNIRLNEDPAFIDVQQQNYRIGSGSPARNWGSPEVVNASPAIPTDLLGNSRMADDGPDAGAIEYVP